MPVARPGWRHGRPPAGRLRGALAWLGDAMQRHQRVIRAIQWCVVLFYATLVVLPAFLPLPPEGAHVLNNLTLLAQWLFWGIWWPFVILSMMLVGRVWCGVLCPEGALSEAVSRRGRKLPIPRWVRWGGWPLVGFVMTTVYGQLISVYEYGRAALLILGGSTVAALVVGYLFGRGKRVWCRYLCPVTGVFGLLAKLAPLHFRVDRSAWEAFPQRTAAVDCAPLLDIGHMTGAAQCHACGRCSGHREAVTLAPRAPDREILALRSGQVGSVEALLLVFGLMGVALGAFQWSMSPWFVAMKQHAADWLVAHEWWWALDSNAPWWLLTHYPQAGDVFSWLDGAAILAYIGATAFIVGGASVLALRLGAALVGARDLDWRVLAMALIPAGGLSVFLGLSMLTLSILRAEGIVVPYVAVMRIGLLALAGAWPLWLGWRLALREGASIARRTGVLVCLAVPLTLVIGSWVTAFFVW